MYQGVSYGSGESDDKFRIERDKVLTEALLLIRKLRSTGRADCGLKAYEVVRFAVVSSVRGRQYPVGEGRRSSGGWVGDARGGNLGPLDTHGSSMARRARSSSLDLFPRLIECEFSQ